jgi:hypothetical protein
VNRRLDTQARRFHAISIASRQLVDNRVCKDTREGPLKSGPEELKMLPPSLSKLKLMSPIRFLSVSITVLAFSVLFAAPRLADAATISATATPFTGASLSVTATIDDSSDPGNLVITLEVDDDGRIGDLRGFFANISDDSLLPGLSVSGPEVTSSRFDENNVINLGGGSNLMGGGTPCPCDLGVEIGDPGIGHGDDFQKVTFVLSHVSEDLDLSLFEEQAFGIRVTSVGSVGGSREGSSKLEGRFPVVPEPSTAILMAIGLLGLSAARSDRQESRKSDNF